MDHESKIIIICTILLIILTLLVDYYVKEKILVVCTIISGVAALMSIMVFLLLYSPDVRIENVIIGNEGENDNRHMKVIIANYGKKEAKNCEVYLDDPQKTTLNHVLTESTEGAQRTEKKFSVPPKCELYVRGWVPKDSLKILDLNVVLEVDGKIDKIRPIYQ